MLFLFGFWTGILVAILVLLSVLFFRRYFSPKLHALEKQIEIHSPRPKGYVVEPKSEADQTREEIIAQNKAQGKDTHISDLL